MVGVAGIGISIGHLTMTHPRTGRRFFDLLYTAGVGEVCDQLVPVARMDGLVAISMEHYSRHGPDSFSGNPAHRDWPTGASASHGGERRGEVVGGTGGEAGVDTDRGIQIRVGLR